MESKKRKRLDYYPLIALFLFWFFGAFAGALQINEPGRIALGLITAPAIVLIIIAALEVRKLHRKLSDS